MDDYMQRKLDPPTYNGAGSTYSSYLNVTNVTNIPSYALTAPAHSSLSVAVKFTAGLILSIITICGNALVTTAFYRCKRLQTANNLYIFSLALSDLLVGIFSINFYTMYVALQRWPLGTVTCNAFLVLDYVCSQVSVTHVLLISFDRYLAVSKPLFYRARRTKRRVQIAIAIAWTISIIQWAPWIISYPYITGKRSVRSDACYVQFLYESWYPTVLTALAAYYAPVVLMVTAYTRIYMLLRRRVCGMPRLTSEVMLARYSKRNSMSSQKSDNRVVLQFPDKVSPDVEEAPQSIIQQKKAAKILSFILASFVLTWLPYHVCVLVAPFCKTCVTTTVWNFSYMLCYVNSTLNPLCYALGSTQFRKAFREILCKKHEARFPRLSHDSVKRIVRRTTIEPNLSQQDLLRASTMPAYSMDE